jgi:aspartate racemase
MPNGQEIACLDQIIFKELAHQIISEKSRKTLIKIIHRLVNEMGVEGVVLGCTELPLLLNQKQTEIPLFNTTKIHVNAIINVLLKPV